MRTRLFHSPSQLRRYSRLRPPFEALSGRVKLRLERSNIARPIMHTRAKRCSAHSDGESAESDFPDEAHERVAAAILGKFRNHDISLAYWTHVNLLAEKEKPTPPAMAEVGEGRLSVIGARCICVPLSRLEHNHALGRDLQR